VKDRRAFLAAVSATGVALLAAKASADPTGPPQPAASPSGAPPAATQTPKPPSEAALATARAMRRFDPQLTEAQIERIARDIESNAKAAVALNPGGRALHNWDEPVTTFAVTA
jgi:hypothetical protein